MIPGGYPEENLNAPLKGKSGTKSARGFSQLPEVYTHMRTRARAKNFANLHRKKLIYN